MPDRPVGLRVHWVTLKLQRRDSVGSSTQSHLAMTGHITDHLGVYDYGTQVYRLPPEPPMGTIVVPLPDRGGPYWQRDDLHPIQRWRQSKSGDHRSVTWGEVLFQAHGAVQVLPNTAV